MWRPVINSSALIGWNIHSSLNTVISTNERNQIYNKVTWFITWLTDKSDHSLMSSNHFQRGGRCLVQLSHPRMDQAFLWKLRAFTTMEGVEKLFLYEWLDVPGHPFVVPLQRREISGRWCWAPNVWCRNRLHCSLPSLSVSHLHHYL